MNQNVIAPVIDLDSPGVSSTPSDAIKELTALANQNGGPYEEPEEYRGSVGRTLFDSLQSQDGTLTVVLTKEDIDRVPSQSLLRIRSMPDRREFTGIVSAGPFAEPDGLSPQSPSLIISAVNKAMMMPNYHGRMQVSLMTELLDGRQVAPRHRPKPNSPVWTVPDDEMSSILNIHGDVRLGVVDGHESIPVLLPSKDKSVLPRHTAMLGTTGGGKSTTVATIISELQSSEVSVILFDTEGEYTTIHQPTTNVGLLDALRHRGLPPKGLSNTHVYHLINRDCANPAHPSITKFTLRFSNMSPWALKEIMDLSDAQEERLFEAYEISKKILESLKVFPDKSNQTHLRMAADHDEFSQGWPFLTLYQLLYVVCACLNSVDKRPDEAPQMPLPQGWAWDEVKKEVAKRKLSGNVQSWKALSGRLGRLNRLKIFDQKCADIDYAAMLTPGRVSIIDLSDLDNYSLRNLAIAELLRGIQEQQEAAYTIAAQSGATPTPVNIMIEEAHEFLSAHRIGKMPIIREQLERIARRGRKRYLGLTFITQMPQHLPDEMLSLVNNWIIHKIADDSVLRRLQKVVQNVDPGVWGRVPSLAPGQALVSMTHVRKALLTLIDPAPCELRMAD